MKYVCLLRGINVGGNNKVAMSDLKILFTSLGFKDVKTHINSGNVIFSSDVSDVNIFINKIEDALKKEILELKVTVVSRDQLADNINNAPADWGKDDTKKHNLLFVRPPFTAKQAMLAIGAAKPEIEIVTLGDQVIYWSASLEEFGRTASSKLASKPIYKEVTVRNYNTSVKLLELMQND